MSDQPTFTPPTETAPATAPTPDAAAAKSERAKTMHLGHKISTAFELYGIDGARKYLGTLPAEQRKPVLVGIARRTQAPELLSLLGEMFPGTEAPPASQRKRGDGTGKRGASVADSYTVTKKTGVVLSVGALGVSPGGKVRRLERDIDGVKSIVLQAA